MATVMVPNGDLLEPLPEVARPTGDFVAPCDLVYRDEQGSERILYDCISGSTKENACAALDAAVSFDAKTVAFTVFRGPLARIRGSANGKLFDPAAENLDYFYVELLGSIIQPIESQIVLVDIATGKQTRSRSRLAPRTSGRPGSPTVASPSARRCGGPSTRRCRCAPTPAAPRSSSIPWIPTRGTSSS